MKIPSIWPEFRWYFPTTICQNWCRSWFGADQATSLLSEPVMGYKRHSASLAYINIPIKLRCHHHEWWHVLQRYINNALCVLIANPANQNLHIVENQCKIEVCIQISLIEICQHKIRHSRIYFNDIKWLENVRLNLQNTQSLNLITISYPSIFGVI